MSFKITLLVFGLTVGGLTGQRGSAGDLRKQISEKLRGIQEGKLGSIKDGDMTQILLADPIACPADVEVNCAWCGLLYYGNDTPGHNNFYAVSALSCQQQCQFSYYCDFFSYNRNNNICTLKRWPGGKQSNATITFGPNECPSKNSTDCNLSGTLFKGKLGRPSHPITSVDDCQKTCANTKGCDFFSYDSSSTVCQPLSWNPFPQIDTVFGYKSCN